MFINSIDEIAITLLAITLQAITLSLFSLCRQSEKVIKSEQDKVKKVKCVM